VGDSEDEDEEEMLDALTSPSTAAPPSPKDTHNHTDAESHLLIIDNITYVTSPILKNSHVQGQALLTDFMRSLAHITRRHNVCTIIHNTAVTYSNTSAGNNNNNSTTAEHFCSTCTFCFTDFRSAPRMRQPCMLLMAPYRSPRIGWRACWK
jgi:hypothetical protein